MQRKDIARRLASGVTAKLDFDYICERGNSFSEYYMHGAMNEILASLLGPTEFRINTGYPHSSLQRSDGPAPGRNREVDFFVEPYSPEFRPICIEAKWADSSHCSWDRVVLDLCRLMLVKEVSPAAECLFVLAGSTGQVGEVLSTLQAKLPEQPGKGKSTGILELPGENLSPFWRRYKLKDWGGRFLGNDLILKGLPLRKNGKPKIPVTIGSTLIKSCISSSGDWQTIVWRMSDRSSAP